MVHSARIFNIHVVIITHNYDFEAGLLPFLYDLADLKIMPVVLRKPNARI